MKRDWDIIRNILLRLEEKGPDDQPMRAVDFSDYRPKTVAYHAELLNEATLIDAEILKTDVGAEDFIGFRLTWAGHELLDAIKSDTVWEKTKRTFLDKGVSMTFELLQSVAAKVAAELLMRTGAA